MEKNIKKSLPQAIDAEKVILGTVLSIPSTMGELSLLINSNHFYVETHVKIFEAFKSLYMKSKPIDLITVTNILKNRDELDLIGGPMYLSQLMSRVVSGVNLEYHARIVTEKYLLRKMIADANSVIDMAFSDTDPFILSDFIENNMSQIKSSLIGTDLDFDHPEFTEKVFKKIQEHKTHGLIGITTGNTALDGFTGGWAEPDLIILAGRPGTGKTTRMLEFAKQAMKAEKQCIIFSLEMSREQLIKKLFSNVAKIHSDKFRNNKLDGFDLAKLNEANEDIKSLPLVIIDKSAINLNYIRAVCRERKKKYGLNMIFIDYLQLISSNEFVKGKSQEQVIAEISIGLKSLAKDLQIPVMALSQLSRESEKRSDKRPIKSDLRHSGQIEQDADIIFGLYRPSQYGECDDFKTENYDRELFPRISELLILKNRHGESDMSLVEYFYGEFSRFEQIPIEQEYQF